MADISSIKAVEFTEQARKVATLFDALYWEASKLQRLWYGQSMSAVITNTSDLVGDGRQDKPLTGADVTAVITRCDEFVNDYKAGSFAKLNTITKASDLQID